VCEICDKLCELILEGKAELRDIYSIGMYFPGVCLRRFAQCE